MDSFDIGRDLRPALGVRALSCDGEVDEGFDELLFSEFRDVPRLRDSRFTIPGEFLPDDDFRIWLVGAYSVSVEGKTISPRGCARTNFHYPSVEVVRVPPSARPAV